MSENSVLVASKQQITGKLSGEVVILSLKNGIYYGLHEVGHRVWELIQEPTTLGQIHKVIQHEYDVDAAQSRKDLEELIDDLLRQGLIEVTG